MMRAQKIAQALTLIGIAGALAHAQPTRSDRELTTASPPASPVAMERLAELLDKGKTNQALRMLSETTTSTSNADRGVCGVVDWTSVTPLSSDLFIDAVQDLEGGLVIGGRTTTTGKVWKFSASNNPAGTPDWETEIPGTEFIRFVNVDDDGFIYAAGWDSVSRASVLVKLTPSGGMIWSSVNLQSISAADTLELSDLAVGPDGVPVVGHVNQITQFDPFTGTIMWEVDILNGLPGTYGGAIAVDTRGDVYRANFLFTVFPTVDQNVVVTKFEGTTGRILWSSELPSRGFSVESFAGQTDTDKPTSIHVTRLGNVVVTTSMRRGNVSAPTTDLSVSKFSPDGDILWDHTFGDGASQDAEDNLRNRHMDSAVDADGNVFVLGQHDLSYLGLNGKLPIILKFDSGGFAGNNFISFATNVVSSNSGRIAVDRNGNPYVCAPFQGDTMIRRFDPVTLTPGCSWTYNSVDTRVMDLLVDNGGDIIATWLDPGIEGGIRKIDQEVVLPTQVKSCPNLNVENQSVWAPGVGRLDVENVFFSEGANLPLSYGSIWNVFLLGQFGAQVGVTLDASIELGYRAEIDGGTADLHVPLDVTWTIPGDPIAGAALAIQSEWELDPAARLTTCVTPEFNAGLTGGLTASIFSNAVAKAFGSTLLNQVFIDESFGAERDYVISVRNLLGPLGAPPPGEWISQEIPGTNFEVSFRLPQLSAEGTAITNPIAGNLAFSSQAQDRFLSIDFNVTQKLIDEYLDRYCKNPLVTEQQCDLLKEIVKNSYKFDQSISGGRLKLEFAILQLLAVLDLAANQDLDVTVTPRVRYEFSDGLSPIDQQLDATLNIGAFPADGDLEVTPFVYATATFQNSSGSSLIPGVEFNTFKIKASASASGRRLINVNECFLCAREDIADVPVELFNNSWAFSFPEVELAPFRVKGSDNSSPVLAAASRLALPMIIYDQTSPQSASFNAAANGRTKMLLYGDRFDLAGSPTAKIVHHGRTEALTTTVINTGTLLVEVPNRFRLLPGVARIWVERPSPLNMQIIESSGTIDIPVEYPVPLLDAVNPNLWAADPDLNTIPIQVIDRKTLHGTDTFITRRDYYIKMRDDLWNNTTAGGTAADVYFPCFDFNGMPEFPAVLFSGMPLPRFIQPIDSGIHNVRLAEQNYDSPGLIPVQICNPGPGGGVSQTLTLDIAAPQPVVARVVPGEIEPGGGLDPMETDLRIIVRGPMHVPTWNGYEEPKFGNFNALSVVRFDGVDLVTSFISSSELHALVPAASIQTAFVARITVFTPDNGSFYFEELRGDGDSDGVPNVLPFFQGFKPSGGESPPIFFPIRYREPVITELSPPDTPAGNVSFSAPQPGWPNYNLAVFGENFREGAEVLIDGDPRPTEFVSRELLRVLLPPEDVAIEGRRRISVRTPAVAGQSALTSTMVEFTITAP